MSTTPLQVRRRLKGRLLWALWLAVAAVAVGQSGRQAAAGAEPAKLDFWSRLLEPVLEEANGSTPALERVARKMADWPDQHRAALSYLELVARRQAAGASATPSWCRRASFAELSAGAAKARLLPPSHMEGDLYRDWIRLNELPSAMAARLNQAPSLASEWAKLAVENANLISRLLVRPESGVIRGLVSREFLKYLLESRVRQLSEAVAGAGPQPSGARSKLQQQLLHSAGLVFFGHQATQELTDGELVNGGRLFAPLTLTSGGQIETIDLSGHPTAASPDGGPNSYFRGPDGGHAGQPFIGKWSGAARDEQTRRLELLLGQLLSPANGLEGRHSLTLEDGRWFSPYLDCGVTNRWLLTFSVPFFASSGSSEQDIRVR